LLNPIPARADFVATSGNGERNEFLVVVPFDLFQASRPVWISAILSPNPAVRSFPRISILVSRRVNG